jgi:hypothetical protein
LGSGCVDIEEVKHWGMLIFKIESHTGGDNDDIKFITYIAMITNIVAAFFLDLMNRKPALVLVSAIKRMLLRPK